MKDFVLELSFDAADTALEELLQSRLYLTASTGSASDERGIAAYFDSPEERQQAIDAVRDLEGLTIATSDRERRDWLELYRQSLEPLFIGERFVVAPDASLIPAGGGLLSLVVPQEQAFGTGSHESTALCIELLEWLDLEGRRGLDVGAGSGILALAMLRLGAARAIAFDNDLDAYAALRENRERNGITPARMPLFIGGLESLRAGAFDVVTMNILPEVIVQAMPHLVWRMAPKAKLVVSGVLFVRANEVVSWASKYSLDLMGEREKGEWWAGVFTLPR